MLSSLCRHPLAAIAGRQNITGPQVVRRLLRSRCCQEAETLQTGHWTIWPHFASMSSRAAPQHHELPHSRFCSVTFWVLNVPAGDGPAQKQRFPPELHDLHGFSKAPEEGTAGTVQLCASEPRPSCIRAGSDLTTLLALTLVWSCLLQASALSGGGETIRKQTQVLAGSIAPAVRA